MRPRARALLGSLAAASLAVACASPPPPPLPQPREVLEYRLQPGDRLDVKVFAAPELDQQLVIRPDGWASVAPLQDLKAAGRTLEQVDAAITQGLANYFEDPQVTVVVREFANRNVYVGGEVGTPGLVALGDGMTAIMAIFEAGGFRLTAQTTNVLVLRNGEGDGGEPRVITLDMKAVLEEARADLRLEPFDVVFVPKSRIARVNLFVEQYIKRMLPFTLVGSANYTYVDGIDEGTRVVPVP